MVRVPQNIFFWNASAVFGKLINSIPLTPTTTYEETFISIEIYIVSLLLLLKTAPAILNCHAWISNKSAQMLSLNFRNLLGDKPPVQLHTTDLQAIRAKTTKSSSLRHSTLLTSQFGNPVSRVWSLFRTIKGLMHFVASRFIHNCIALFASSDHSIYPLRVVSAANNIFTIIH